MNPSPAQPTILVTGGAGFIGSHLVAHLTEQGSNVVVVDTLDTGRLTNLHDLPKNRLTFIHAGVSDALADFAPDRFCEIYHLAAAVGVRLVIDQPIHTIETNVHETAAVLRFASAAHTPTLIASTSEVYGKGSKTPFAEDDDVVYGPTTLSRWSYACSKAIDEYLALASHREHDLPVVIARFFNTVGPRQLGRYGMVLPRFIEAALRNEPLQVYGDGKQTRCFCDVRDVVNVLPMLVRQTNCHGRVFNVGADSVVSIYGLAELVIRTLGSQSKINLVPYTEAFGPGFDDLHERQPDLSRIQQATGWRASIALEQTIREVAAEMSSHESFTETTR